MDRLLFSVLAALLVFAICLLAALAGGLAFAMGNVVWDAVARAAAGVGESGRGPLAGDPKGVH